MVLQQSSFRVMVRHNQITIGDVFLNNRWPELQFPYNYKWSNHKKAFLIESILLRIPIPVVDIHQDARGHMYAVHNQEVMGAIKAFLNDTVVLDTMIGEYSKSWFGMRYSTLRRDLQRRIEESYFNYNLIESDTTHEAREYLYARYQEWGT